MWDETTASRGAQEIYSCLIKHLKLNATHKKMVTIYSDSCTGQNRNIKMTLALMRFIQTDETTIDTIDQQFLISGHSFLANDSDFGSVELASKGKTIYTPDHWYDIMATCRRKKKIIVCKMTNDEFYTTSLLERNISKRKKSTDNLPVNWLKMQWIRIEKKSPYTIQYKENLQEFVHFQVLNIMPTGRKGRPVELQNVPLEKLYANKRPVGAKKKQDMIDLLPFIPPVYHAHFNDLIVTEEEEETGPLPYIEEADN